ncbi:hypothetical protein SAMN05444747_1393 [Variovorax sp. OV329]|nr:hypothetical protein SAMN05444747_1393 [Variovorax sp. OV329]
MLGHAIRQFLPTSPFASGGSSVPPTRPGRGAPETFSRRQAFWVLELAALHVSDRDQALHTLRSWCGPARLSGEQVKCVEDLLQFAWPDLVATLADGMEDCELRERLRMPGVERTVMHLSAAAHDEPSRATKARLLRESRGEVFRVRGQGYRLGSHLPPADSAYEELRVCRLLYCDDHHVAFEDTYNGYRFSEALSHVTVSRDQDQEMPLLVVAPRHRS